MGGGPVGGCWVGQVPLGRPVTGIADVGGLPTACCLPDLEGQLWPVGVADVEVQTILDVDGRHPAAVDVHAVEAAVVDG